MLNSINLVGNCWRCPFFEVVVDGETTIGAFFKEDLLFPSEFPSLVNLAFSWLPILLGKTDDPGVHVILFHITCKFPPSLVSRVQWNGFCKLGAVEVNSTGVKA